jgi:CRISPR/Cas system-associated exonuclease Cas4 (RecB family)
MSEQRNRVVRASEIGQYVYCAHAWWLGSVEGLPSTHQQEMAAGETAHLRHGRRVRASLGLGRLAYGVLLLAAMVAVVWLVSEMFGW